MTVAVACTVLLGFLLFGLGFAVSLMRGKSNTGAGYKDDPSDRLYKLVRAHGNTAEYAPMLAVLMLYLGSQSPAMWILWIMGIVTLARYLQVVGMLMSPTLQNPHPARFVGSLVTYVGGLALCVGVVLKLV